MAATFDVLHLRASTDWHSTPLANPPETYKLTNKRVRVCTWIDNSDDLSTYLCVHVLVRLMDSYANDVINDTAAEPLGNAGA